MKTALVTGGQGFLGHALTKELRARGYQVFTFDTQYGDPQFHRHGSIVDFESILYAVKDVDIVFHLAALLGTTELLNMNAKAVDVNIKGTVNVFEACYRMGVPRVFFPTKANIWLNTYSITKEAGEKFAQMYRHVYGLDVRILRWLNAYGPRQKLFPIRKAVPIMILQALNDLPIEIYGDGNQMVELVYIGDVAKVTVAYMEHSIGDSVIRDTGHIVQMSVNEMVSHIKHLTQSKSPIVYLPMRPGEETDKSVEFLSDSVIEFLGIKEETTDIRSGLENTIAYYRALPERVKFAALKFYYGFIHETGSATVRTKPYVL